MDQNQELKLETASWSCGYQNWDNKIAHAKNRETFLFNRIVTAIQTHNDVSARILSSELAKVRHNQRMLNQARRIVEHNGDFGTSYTPH